jgi:hypothetical protein
VSSDLGRLSVTPADVPLTLAAQIGMSFCPWCGTDLKRQYAGCAQALRRPELVIP